MNRFLSMALIAGVSVLTLSACGNDTPDASDTKSFTDVKVDAGDKSAIDKVKNVKVSVFAACMMRNSDGNLWYVSPSAKAEVSMTSLTEFNKGFAAKVESVRGAEELGENPSSANCFIGRDKADAQKKIDRYTTGATENGNKLVKIKYPD